MQKKLRYLLLFSAILVVSLLTIWAVQVNAEENGGVISTKGQITLLEDTTTTETKTSESSKDKTIGPPVGKPSGKLPSTGELIKKSLSISGMVMIGITFCLYWWKRQQRKKAFKGEE
ncbi:LPXTG cell wall anchor domain-containing protein [Enterococcus rivorum]|uniref:Gram-positive cocci surface proteins LPxTG domain-containing protein n=1 Tax=Enterococcus rivorum TaxID=762845 RepID=A0A1E5KSS6_9ENTE|nr:LPXTG cell wall anchor domain-containing protein [Enterococcus rivorum]MBP2098160.1 LPXTG-motif cell wall-anchored protein [Enterococcus rivorum]OEH80916.1 hypothetical protein BCR26_06710 [Enterococcus rivorum]